VIWFTEIICGWQGSGLREHAPDLLRPQAMRTLALEAIGKSGEAN
jgi:hypothetical protein